MNAREVSLVDIPAADFASREIVLPHGTVRAALSPFDLPERMRVGVSRASGTPSVFVDFLYAMVPSEPTEAITLGSGMLQVGTKSGRVFRYEFVAPTPNLRASFQELDRRVQELQTASNVARLTAHYGMVRDLVPLVEANLARVIERAPLSDLTQIAAR